MNRLLTLYPYLAAFILAPLSGYLWWQTYQNWPQMLVAWLTPVLWAYIVPGVGTNICKVWEVKSRWNMGRFRIQHGFVFGSATGVLVWLVHGAAATSLIDVFKTAFIVASVLGFWNILYDIVAIRAGILHIYNQPFAEGKGVDAIVMDYAPWIFGGFGAAYGLLVAGLEYYVRHYGVPGLSLSLAILLFGLAVSIAVPVLGFMRHSYKKHGHTGTRPIELNK
ncbi:hypothetical protein [Budvicia aquatica]|uniref:Uncharacterized protein n=1 Tax=Budvicia aquatica TaxID=82979 RepID=A0A2C6DJT4_9GAMM|nr:hypothetical protein [Budvicia aquatica]MBP9643915.1 hypothetical protein [Budvicia sp.]PHI29091.1 hypothetical protein CRN84_07040 [Budvicia aquatica]VFS47251.1 Uncharacterised protein [Budvicia aquatica]